MQCVPHRGTAHPSRQMELIGVVSRILDVRLRLDMEGSIETATKGDEMENAEHRSGGE